MSGPAGWRPDGVASPGVASPERPPVVPPRVATSAADLDLGPEALFLAGEVARLAPADDPAERGAALLLALAVLAAEREGSTRVPSDPAVLRPLLERLGGEPDAVRRALERASDPSPETPWLGASGEYRPLLTDGHHVSAQRLRFLEARLGDRLHDRLERPALPGGERLDAILTAIRERPPLLATGVPVLLSPEQEQAVRGVVERPLSVVTGGPGTGKTSVVVSILRARARWKEWDDRAVALAAPTGRAADRLRASLLRFLAAVPDPPAPDRALVERPPIASTLHRLLGYSPRSGRFRHHEHHPLPHELVVVDESSMVDLDLMDRLLRSLAPEAHLVFLGDSDQLPSVGAGAVFRDLCRARALTETGAAVRLTHSYRMDAEDPAGRAILRAASRVRGGEPLRIGVDVVERAHPEEVTLEGVELLGGGRRRRVTWWERWAASLPEPAEAAGRTFHHAEDGDFPPGERTALDALLEALEGARILAAHRSWAGGTGAAAVNRWFHEHHARSAGLGLPGSEPLPGEPVLATRNDYRRGLFNGDQGVVVRVADRAGRTSHQAVFRIEGRLRPFPVEALRGGLELAWATTVHKAQGSEMDRVTLVLPDQPTRILDRELVYTAVTRARRSVVLLGSPEVLAEAVGRSLERSTTLGELLADTKPPLSDERLDPPPSGGQLSLWD